MAPLFPRCSPLPQVPGPKLAPFTATGHADIKFIERLSSSDAKDGYVWKVEIQGTSYALKMFHFNTWKWLRKGPGNRLTSSLAKRQFYHDYFDPFCCECRVYGRLKEERREDLAVRAHGYLFLTPGQEAQVTGLMITDEPYKPDDDESELNGEKAWHRYEEHRGHPVRAIVKDLVITNKALEAEQIPNMWSDLKELHALGIVVQDIHIGNYLDGKLVDFSRAWTMYHPCLDEARVLDLDGVRVKDPRDLEDMIDYTCRYVDKVPKELHECAQEIGDCRTDPQLYDWVGRGGKEAVAHVQDELYGECP